MTTLVSAATGVTWTFVFIPLYFTGLYLLLTSPSRSAKFLLSFGLAGLLLSHLPTALTLSILRDLALYVFTSGKYFLH